MLYCMTHEIGNSALVKVYAESLDRCWEGLKAWDALQKKELASPYFPGAIAKVSIADRMEEMPGFFDGKECEQVHYQKLVECETEVHGGLAWELKDSWDISELVELAKEAEDGI